MEDKNFQMHNFINNPQMMLESSNRLPQENLQDLKSSYVAKWVWNCPSEGIAVKQPACTTETKYIVKASKELEYNGIVNGFWSSNSRAIFTNLWNKTKQNNRGKKNLSGPTRTLEWLTSVSDDPVVVQLLCHQVQVELNLKVSCCRNGCQTHKNLWRWRRSAAIQDWHPKLHIADKTFCKLHIRN